MSLAGFSQWMPIEFGMWYWHAWRFYEKKTTSAKWRGMLQRLLGLFEAGRIWWPRRHHVLRRGQAQHQVGRQVPVGPDVQDSEEGLTPARQLRRPPQPRGLQLQCRLSGDRNNNNSNDHDRFINDNGKEFNLDQRPNQETRRVCNALARNHAASQNNNC